jgi:hypothetical protein
MMRPKGKIQANIKATAKFHAVAKAAYQRKKTITEVIPPDVSRAKASAWLTLISPITEWAGLKGDALRNRRAQLRIEQEESLAKLAQSVTEKCKNYEIMRPVPAKILVPLLEKASLEEPTDQLIIDLWANLLLSATSEESIPPRFVNIIGELNSRQAIRFMHVVSKGAEIRDTEQLSIVFEMRESNLRDRINRLFARKRLTAANVYAEFIEDLMGPCVALIDLWAQDSKGGHWLIPTDENPVGDWEAQSDLQILASLGLLREIRIDAHRSREGINDITIMYFLLTEFGSAFYEAVTNRT